MPLALLLLTAEGVQAAIIGPVVAAQTQQVTTADGGVTWTVQNPVPQLNQIYRSADGMKEARYVFEFPSLGITGPVHVNSASFRFRIGTMISGNPMNLNFYGYGDADGTTSVADALKTTNLVGSLLDLSNGEVNPIETKSTYNISINASFVESVINSGGRVGLVGMAELGQTNTVVPYLTSIYADGWLSYAYPALTVDYTVTPEPATLSLLALGGLVMLRRRPRR